MCLIKDIHKILIILTISNFTTIKSLPTIKTNHPPSATQNNQHISWLQQMRVLRHFIKDCENFSLPNARRSTTWQCFKITTLNVFDDISKRQTIPIWRGVRFIRRPEVNESKETNLNDTWQRKDLQYLTWFDRLALSFNKILNTHMLEINLKELTDAYMDSTREKDLYSSSNTTDPVGTARHRRQRYNMMITMMFGVTALGAVLIPMGFQMLSVVSGKALLLAKMALLLASINGLKRVANSGVHYGLYHAPGEHYGAYYDRGDVHHPRNVQNLTPSGHPIEMELSVK